ncbi:MAG TPA: tetratricopeptide repeat protein [Candidatus Acidoferrales bacterium]|jgi:tetratricopeptide (TPR) repeat protein|nr:tetratricopeptide repeat protein [Candidatus Acidoferrales bacterium]
MNDSKESFNQIRLADDRGQTAVVVELCKKHLRKYPKHGIAWLYFGIAETELAQYRIAEKAIRRAMVLCPKQALPVVYSQMGHLLQAKGELKGAAIWYCKAVKQKSHDATYHIFLGSNAFKRGSHKESKARYYRAIECSEGCLDEAYFNLGGLFLGQRNYPEAIKCYEAALKIDPQYKIAKKRLDDAKLALLIAAS